MIKRLARGFTGLNTVLDPTRIPYSHETGISDLQVAVNVQLDDTGRVSRVDGYEEVASGSYHSLYCDGGDCFVGNGTALYRVASDLSLTGVRSPIGSDRISYAQVGPRTYYTQNEQFNGYIIDGVSYPWSLEDYHGPETTRHFETAPKGRHISYGMSRMFVSVGDVIYWSEPWKPGLFNLAENHIRMPSRIIMLEAMPTGLFVSDEHQQYFLQQTEQGFAQREVAPYPAVEWSVALERIEGMDLGLDPGLCKLWASKEGLCLGTANGQFYNLNRSKIIYPENVSEGASLLRGYQLIHTVR